MNSNDACSHPGGCRRSRTLLPKRRRVQIDSLIRQDDCLANLVVYFSRFVMAVRHFWEHRQ